MRLLGKTVKHVVVLGEQEVLLVELLQFQESGFSWELCAGHDVWPKLPDQSDL